jgi:uncharacterized protein
MLVTLTLLAAISLPPKPDRYVTDHAGVLPNAAALNEKLAAFERQTSDQILVYTDQHLPPDTTIEDLASEAMRTWGVGQKGKDNGAILFVFVADKKMRIEVGYGLEGALTDAKAKNITSTVIKPAFKDGDFAGGIERGADAMMAAIKGESYAGSGKTVAETHEASPGVAMAVVALSCLFPLLIFGVIIFLIIRVAKKYPQNARVGGGTTTTYDSSSSDTSYSSSTFDSSSSSSDSSSSSSFDGGGGSSGGGGASDSW